MHEDIFSVVQALQEEKQRLVSELDFEQAAKARDRIDFLRQRINACYDACSGIKNPEYLPELIKALNDYLKVHRSPQLTALMIKLHE